MKLQYTRRQFLTAIGLGTSAIAARPFLAIHANPGSSALVRRNVAGMDASDPILDSYRAAIKAMQSKPSSDPLSWAYQAAIHGTTLSGSFPAWNTCTHGSYFFWSWHRMYLYWFERIVRRISANDCWCLPYWNWTVNRQLPAVFRETTSDLYTTNRNTAMNNGTGSLPVSYVDYSGAFSLTDFTNASASLEATPHGAVHVGVGGWMGSVPTAAQDPVFYLHHCNIDRLWNLWLAQAGVRTDPLGDSTWRDTKFTFFDENGSQIKMSGCEVLRAAEQLHYVYEGEPPEVKEFCLTPIPIPRVILVKDILFRPPIPPVTLSADPTSVSIDIIQIRQQLATLARDTNAKLFLELDQVEADQQPGIIWEVYLGETSNKNLNSKNPAHIGNVALFGDGVHADSHHGDQHVFKPAHFAFVINRPIQDALRANKTRLPLKFVPRGILIDDKPSRPAPTATVRIGQISITVQTEKENRQ